VPPYVATGGLVAAAVAATVLGSVPGQAAAPSGPVLHFAFDSSAGATVLDSSASALHGTLVNADPALAVRRQHPHRPGGPLDPRRRDVRRCPVAAVPRRPTRGEPARDRPHLREQRAARRRRHERPALSILEAFWDGWLDDVRIYRRALSAAAVDALAP
jgi:hypothetical protein